MASWFSFDSKWRYPGKDEWTETVEQELLKAIKALDLPKIGTKPRVMLCGPNGAGKSAFMNSVIAVCKGRQVYFSHSGSSREERTTLTKKYICVAAPDEFNSFRLIDTPGLLEPRDEGLNIKDVVAVLEGHVKVGYTFKGEEAIDVEDEFYVKNPTEEEKVHCLVFVYDSLKIESYSEKYMSKIREITTVLHSKQIPYCLILTKIDQLDKRAETDIKKIHESAIVKNAVETAAKRFGVEKRSIFPVVNFEKDPDIKPLTKVPHLIAMRNIIAFAVDCLDIRMQNS